MMPIRLPGLPETRLMAELPHAGQHRQVGLGSGASSRWRLLSAGLVLCAVPALAVDREQARRDALEVLARNYLHACTTALETLRLDDPQRLRPLDGQPCAQVPGLASWARLPQLPQSRVTVHPEANEDYQVQVTSALGRVYTSPDVLTPRPPPPRTSLLVSGWVDWALSLLLLAVLTVLLSLIPPVPDLAWLGVPLLVFGGSILALTPRSPPNDGGYIVVVLAYWCTWVWLLLAVCVGLLRRVRRGGPGWSGWTEALGAGLVWALPASPLLGQSILLTFDHLPDQVNGVPRVPLSLLAAAGVLLLLVLGQVWLRRRIR